MSEPITDWDAVAQSLADKGEITIKPRVSLMTADEVVDAHKAVIYAAQTIVEYCPPSILAEMVDEWLEIDEPLYDHLAQIAFDEGVSNCGALGLAKYVAREASSRPTDTFVLHDWIARGIKYTP